MSEPATAPVQAPIVDASENTGAAVGAVVNAAAEEQIVATPPRALRVLDVGCGPGIYVKAMREAGIDADGVDLDPWCPYTVCDVFSDEFKEKFYKKYDLCLSLEVAEHLRPELADGFVERLVSVAPAVLFSAAQPGQGGHGHINCQTKEYWAEKFAKYNYVPDEEARKHIVQYMIDSRYYLGWFIRNIQVFRHYGSVYYKTIIKEETPQAERVARYLKTHWTPSP